MPAPRSIAPEQDLDRHGMRELALSVARSAIFVSERKRFQEEAKSCMVMAIVAAILGFAFLEFGSAVHEILVFAAWIPCAIALVGVTRTLCMSAKVRQLMPVSS
jgi:hypothetical protein